MENLPTEQDERVAADLFKTLSKGEKKAFLLEFMLKVIPRDKSGELEMAEFNNMTVNELINKL